VAVAVAVASAVAVLVSAAAVDVSLVGTVSSAFFSSQADRKQIAITRVAARVFIGFLLAVEVILHTPEITQRGLSEWPYVHVDAYAYLTIAFL
jgi:hypothetical protein